MQGRLGTMMFVIVTFFGVARSLPRILEILIPGVPAEFATEYLAPLQDRFSRFDPSAVLTGASVAAIVALAVGLWRLAISLCLSCAAIVFIHSWIARQ